MSLNAPFGTMKALFDRVLRRTSTDVAVATVAVKAVGTVARWMPPPPKHHTKLTLHWRDGNCMWWTMEPADERHVGVWNEFLKWFHGRPQSRSFVIYHREGSIGFRRSDIRRYAIDYWIA